MPSILKDGALFFPNVLTNQVFQKSGILWGQEAYGIIGLHWVVIDPRRHKMYVWEKHQSDFVQAAYSLGASLFTNGSFNDYVGGNKYVSTAKVFITTFVDSFKGLFFSLSHPQSIRTSWVRNPGIMFQGRAAQFWAGHNPHGNIFGVKESISIVGKPRPMQHYFGRKQGRFFPDYEIGQGSPGGPTNAGGFNEVIGALFRTVNNYTAVDPQTSGIGAGHFGLAPLLTNNNTPADIHLGNAGIKEAVDEYHNKEEHFKDENFPNFQPPANNAPLCRGLIITVFYWGAIIDKQLVSIRVKDAVRIDGNASILLGHHTTAVVGAQMPIHKQNYNKWGYQFQAE
ncbi:MAG: hypothetical protein WCE54_23005 [Ignavibacteriaceae bacterium]